MTTLDTKELRDLTRALRVGEPVLAREFHTALVRSGDAIVVRAKANASFSANIPGTIRTVASATRVAVKAGPGAKPHAGEAAAFENKGVGGTFRHPVFGNYDVWANSRAHPFLTPAGEEALPQAETEILRAVDIFAALLERA